VEKRGRGLEVGTLASVNFHRGTLTIVRASLSRFFRSQGRDAKVPDLLIQRLKSFFGEELDCYEFLFETMDCLESPI
jgi:hypothetical protein